MRIGRCEPAQDSAGHGAYRGGLGVRRDFAVPHTDCTFTVLSDGRRFRPWGLASGDEARAAHYVLDPGAAARAFIQDHP